MIPASFALAWAETLGQLVLGNFRDGLSPDLLRVARVAKVGRAPAEPGRYVAAELTLELDKLRAVLGTLGCIAELACNTRAAHEILGLKVVVAITSVLVTAAQAAKVRLLALEALVVGKVEHGEANLVAMESSSWLQVVMVFHPLQFQSPQRHLVHFLLQSPQRL